MGDDELNFTEEEARCWADDPRNQAQPGHAILRHIAIWLFVLMIALILMCLANSAAQNDLAALPVVGHAANAPLGGQLRVVRHGGSRSEGTRDGHDYVRRKAPHLGM